ncbi:cytochrome c biogenesis protein ResB [Geomonas sp.]|uniref:cytochrome c biogenesis protein ResB n=1 Tax=Geomonas sp. TaxID=2651584 RepID=UPI002B479C4A|nr:cytochrome C biogenesis protein ResB [Geomonas sp.]HJV34293.1 cytochrome C biogenesis protein ResB [Geomonas sp.]
MLKQLYTRLSSLNLGLWLLTGVMVALALGSFSPGSSEQAGLDSVPLFVWLRQAPLFLSWWLWVAVGLIAFLCLNAVVCSIEALRKKGRSIAPHLMHLGFLLIVVAHLFSAYGSFKDMLEVTEGSILGFRDSEQLRVERISGEIGPMGMMTSYRAVLRIGQGPSVTIQPNHPLFHNGYGIYLKEAALSPAPIALLEIHREPGALPALIGALAFTLGNLMLLAQRRKR